MYTVRIVNASVLILLSQVPSDSGAIQHVDMQNPIIIIMEHLNTNVL